MTAVLERAASEAAARAAVARVEELLGDPDRPANPAGHLAALAADRVGRPHTEAEQILHGYGLNDHFVPRDLGGRLDSLDTLTRIMRPVFRRDIALGMSFGSTLMAAFDVWAAGTPHQQRLMRDVLLAGGRAALAQHETAHSNNYVRSRVTLTDTPGGPRLFGTKPVINNMPDAGALVLFCAEGDTRRHSVALLDPRTLPPGHHQVLPRPPSVGLRGSRMAGLRFDGCPLPADALLGEPGGGVRVALRSFQISRTLMSSMVLAAVDTTLRIAAGFAHRHLHGPAAQGAVPSGGSPSGADLKQVPQVLSTAFVNLLLYDALAVVATRAVHLIPAETSIYSAAVKYLLPKVLIETMYDLSPVLGSGVYTRRGTLGVFQKHLRDVPVISLGHAGSVACQATIIPQLRRLAERSWLREESAPAALFELRTGLPRLRTSYLAIARGRDSLSAHLVASAEGISGGDPTVRALRTLARTMVDELADLRARVRALPADDGGQSLSAAEFALTDRYTLVLAAAAVLGVWRHNRSSGDPFLADPAWAAAALHQLAQRLGAATPQLPRGTTARIYHEVLARLVDRRSFDLYNTQLSG